MMLSDLIREILDSKQEAKIRRLSWPKQQIRIITADGKYKQPATDPAKPDPVLSAIEAGDIVATDWILVQEFKPAITPAPIHSALEGLANVGKHFLIDGVVYRKITDIELVPADKVKDISEFNQSTIMLLD